MVHPKILLNIFCHLIYSRSTCFGTCLLFDLHTASDIPDKLTDKLNIFHYN